MSPFSTVKLTSLKSRLLRLGDVGAEPLDEFQQFLFLLLGLLVLVLLLAQGELARFVPEAVIAREKVDVAVINIDRMRAHRIEEVAVVRDDQHRVFVIRQVVLQPRDRRPVEVVGRLVEQQVVGFAEQGLRQQHAHLLLGAQIAHQLAVQGFPDPEAAQQVGGVALGVPALHLREPLLQLPGPETVLLRKVGLGVQRLLLLHRLPQRLMPHQNRVEDRKPVIGEVVLLEHRQAFARAEGHVAPRRGHLAAEHFEERGLPRPVGPDHTVAVARGEFEIDILEKNSFSVLYL